MSAVASAYPGAAADGENPVAIAVAPTVDQLAAALEAQARLTVQLASRLEALRLRLEPPDFAGGARDAGDAGAAGAARPSVFSGPARAGGGLLDEDAPPEARRTRVAVNCFGGFALYVDGTRVDGWRAGKTRTLLQYLITHHDRPVPRETLIAALWPNPDPPPPAPP